MRKFTFYAIVLMFMSTFAFGIQAATVVIDPATQSSPPAGGMLAVDVKVKYVSGLFGYQLDLVFDNTALEFSSIEESEFLKVDGVSTFAFLTSDGQLNFFQDITSDVVAGVNAAGALSVAVTRSGSDIGIDGTGTLVTITFEVLEAKASTLELQSVMLADSDAQTITVDVENGVVEAPVGIKGDVNDDGQIRSNDAILTLRIAAGLMEPNDLQNWAADMNDDGRIRSNDAILILRKAAGLASPGVGISGRRAQGSRSEITVTLAEAHGVAGESITVPVKIDNTYGLAGGDISICYDPMVLRAVNVSSDSDMLLVSNLSESGMARIAFADANELSNETVAKIQFDILADDTSPLTFKAAEFYSPDALPLDPRSIDKEFRSWAIPPELSVLLQNFPNPFNPETWIPYQLRNASEVTIRIYSTAGELVRKLDLGYRAAGLYVSPDRAAHWDGTSKFGIPVASGVYFYSIQAGDFIAVRKLIVLK